VFPCLFLWNYTRRCKAHSELQGRLHKEFPAYPTSTNRGLTVFRSCLCIPKWPQRRKAYNF
jgi:hypothetical protein